MITYTIEEYLTNENNEFLINLYNAWTKFAPSFNFKLISDCWYEIFAALLDGTYEITKKNKEKNQYIAETKDNFYSTYLVEYYTINEINEILRYNNINIEYKWNDKTKTVIIGD